MSAARYWHGPVPKRDDFGDLIDSEFIDGRTLLGPWGLMTPDSWRRHGQSNMKLGTGIGQRYQLQSDGGWLKVEG
jgi:hypothetical protein